jgi:hypothetical protein
MKRRLRRTESLFPEPITGAENPWFTEPRRRTDDEARKRCGLTTLELCAGGVVKRSAMSRLELTTPAWWRSTRMRALHCV